MPAPLPKRLVAPLGDWPEAPPPRTVAQMTAAKKGRLSQIGQKKAANRIKR